MRYIIPGSGRFETVVKKSRFICSVRWTPSVAAARAAVAEIAAEFADASHNCWAYKVGAPDDTSQLGCSDDGEPKGTAGRPMLTVVRHADLGDVTVVVSRYFGGTKLGTGGLVKAYGDSVKLALAAVERTEKVARSEWWIDAEYASVDVLKRGFPDYEAMVLDEAYGAMATFRVAVPDDCGSAFCAWVESLRGPQMRSAP